MPVRRFAAVVCNPLISLNAAVMRRWRAQTPHTPLCADAPPWGRAPRLEAKVKGISLDDQKDLRRLAELFGGPAPPHQGER